MLRRMERTAARLKPLVGWALGGPSVRPRPPRGAGRLGEPAWSPSQLLRDLELRLGLPKVEASAAQRVPIWSKRLASHIARAASAPFYARSFAFGRAYFKIEDADDIFTRILSEVQPHGFYEAT